MILVATGIGDVPLWLADEGLQKAQRYFDKAGVDPYVARMAYNNDRQSVMAQHWKLGMDIANSVLEDDDHYADSMIDLDFEPE